MRISTTWHHQLGVNGMLDQQVKMNQTQMKLSTGKKYLTPSENPSAASNQIDLQQNIKENEQYQVNINAARQRLELQESGLENATDTLQRIRELAVQGLNDSNTAINRQEIAFEIDALNKHLFALANTQNANGEYIFSGYKTNVAPFTNSSGYAYIGDSHSREIGIGPNQRTLTEGDPGDAVFGAIQTAPLTAGNLSNIFQAVEKLSTDLKANTPNRNSLDDLDRTLTRFATIRASTGARLHALEQQENLNAEYILANKSTASEIGDLDYAEALSQFNLQQISLQAAQQAFTKVQNLSLFNYI